MYIQEKKKMHLQRLILTDFKNIRNADITFSQGVNCFLGNNGAGKTNLLDAVHYLSMTRSYFSHIDAQAISFGAPFFSLSGHYLFEDAPGEHIVCVAQATGEKWVKRNDKNYARFSEHLGLLPIVMISPSDTQLIHGSAEERRRFLNALLSQMDLSYLSVLQQYNKILIQRNQYLKQGGSNVGMIEAFDLQLSAKATVIYQKRVDLCKRLAPEAQKYYAILSGKAEELSLSYRSDLENSSLESLLKESFSRDQALGFTSLGIHRDDVVFMLNHHSVRKFGSQGQQKTFLLALKLAQFEVMKHRSGTASMLLLDDVFDKLDMNRVAHLLKLVAQEHFGQIFITDSNKARMESVINQFTNEYAIFDVNNGVIKRGEA